MEHSWLFRQGDLTMGPVPTQHVVDMLYRGELSPASEVQQVGSGRFLALADVPDFRVHVAKAEAKQRVDAQARSLADAHKKALRRKLIMGGAGLVALALVVVTAGSYLAVHWAIGGDSEEGIEIDTPAIFAAKRTPDEELVAYQGATRKTPPPGTGATKETAHLPRSQGSSKPGMGSAEPDGLQMGEVDEAGISSVVAKHKASLYPCIKAVAQPGVFLKLPIEFAVAEGGKVSKVWVDDNPSLKGSGLEECLLKELQKWPFKPAHAGNTIKLPVNVGKKP